MVLLVRDQKLNFLQLSRSFKISGVLERLDYILQFLCMMHEAVDMRLAAVHVQMGASSDSAGVCGFVVHARNLASALDTLGLK